MKKIYSMIAGAALLTGGLTACTGAQGLADRISGSWQSEPAPIASDASGITTMTDLWTFTPESEGADQGSLTITSMTSVEWPLDAAATDTIAPSSDAYAVSLSAKVAITGTWEVSSHDPDDELLVTLDPKSLSVAVDPAGEALSGNGNPVVLDSIPAPIFNAARAEILKIARGRFFPINRLEDVEFKADKVEFEVPSTIPGHDEVKITLRRVDAAN